METILFVIRMEKMDQYKAKLKTEWVINDLMNS